MTVIAMPREMGTLGKDVAQGVADSLNLKVVHTELIEHDVAKRLGVGESAVHRYLEGSASMIERWKIDKRRLARYTAEEILELAQQDNIIIRGWGAVAVLRDIPHVLHVRVCAPSAFRERVMMERLGHRGVDLARFEIEQNDAAHGRLMRDLFGFDWQDPQHYHVVLNSAVIPIKTGVRIVRLLAASQAMQRTATTRPALADKLLERRVGYALDGDGSFGPAIKVEAAAGRITLTGAVTDNRLSIDAEKAVRSVPRVTEVKNRIQVIQDDTIGM